MRTLDFPVAGVSITDPDANPNTVQVTLTVTHGIVSLKASAIPTYRSRQGTAPRIR